ncbi:MAG: hypothetical protein AAF940_00080 [Pseudomonadota bacterium]
MRLTYRHFLHAAAFCIAVFFAGLGPANATSINKVFRGNPTHIVVHVSVISNREERETLGPQLTNQVMRLIEERATAEKVALEVRNWTYDYKAEGVLPSKLLSLLFSVRIAQEPQFPKPAAYNYVIYRQDADGEVLSASNGAPIITSLEGLHADSSSLERSIKETVDDILSGVFLAKSIDGTVKKRDRRRP